MAGLADIAKVSGVKQEDVSKVFKGLVEIITSGEDDRVTIPNLGSFQYKFQKERDSRNPSTGEIVGKTPEKLKGKFTFTRELDEKIDNLKIKKEYKKEYMEKEKKREKKTAKSNKKK